MVFVFIGILVPWMHASFGVNCLVKILGEEMIAQPGIKRRDSRALPEGLTFYPTGPRRSLQIFNVIFAGAAPSRPVLAAGGVRQPRAG